jgi:uncharacterized protein (DUF362 family)
MSAAHVVVKRIQDLAGNPVAYPAEDISKIKIHLDSALRMSGYDTGKIKNSSILIHPNLVRPNPSEIPASSTDPRVILALGTLMKDYGARIVKVGENPGFGLSCRQAFILADLVEPLHAHGIAIADFDEEEWVDVPNPDAVLFRNVKVARAVLETEIFINLPKWKTHMLTGVSLAIKNLLGIIHDNQRMFFHRNDIIHKIVDLVSVRYPDLNIIEGLWAMEGQAPFHGEAVKDFGGLIVSEDILAADIVAAELMGFKRTEIPHLMVAIERLWQGNPREIIISGDDTEALRRLFKKPVLSSAGQFPGISCIECGVCNGCLSAIRHSLDKMNFEGKLGQSSGTTIVSGRSMPNQTTFGSCKGPLILFGNCAIEFQFYDLANRQQGIIIPGCPPHVLDLARILGERNADRTSA